MRLPSLFHSLFLAMLLLTGAVRAAETFTPQALMTLLAHNKTNRADFVDRKFLSSMDRPLESSGELLYTAPARLEKRTLKPKPETLIVDGDALTIERNGTRRSISLASYPEIAPFVDSIRATLAGDLATLSRDYRVTVDGTADNWRLVLLPSDQRIATTISRVTLTGHDGLITTFEVLQADGNRSVSTITPHRDGP
jgi:outer membrane lipoprotein-sorting protein